jgi:membrane protein
MHPIEERIRNHRLVNTVKIWGKRVVLPGFNGVSIYDAMSLFFKALFFGSLPQRASAIAFSFFLAIFPTILFFFTIIPYLPIENLNVQVLGLIEETMPPSIFSLIADLVNDITQRTQFGLLSFGFVTAFLFATNGFQAIIGAFNTSIMVKEHRSFWQIQWISLVLLIIVSFTIFLAVAIMTFYEFFLNFFNDQGYIQSGWVYNLIVVGNWVIEIALIYFTFSFIYFFAPQSGDSRYRLFSSGATFATILFMVSYLIFNYYAANFATYNALYGSIGTLILFMLWLYFDAFVLLLGFELNASIKEGKLKLGKTGINLTDSDKTMLAE